MSGKGRLRPVAVPESSTLPTISGRAQLQIAALTGFRDSAEIVGGTPEQFGEFIRSEVAKWAKVVKEAGIKAD